MEYTKTELRFERIWSIARDFIVYALMLGIIAGGMFILFREETSAMSLKTTLTGRPDIVEMLQKSRGYNTYEIANYIATHEGFSEVPFNDPSGIGQVIGFGFQPRGRTYMSRKEGIAILNAEVERLIKKITPVYGFVSQNKMTALVSILYNTPIYARIIHDERIIQAFREDDLTVLQSYFINHSMRGIRERRAEELALYFNQQVL